MKKLPIGEQDFSFLRVDDNVYVDKTEYLYRMLTGSGRAFFLSRPRRFGKTLMVSMMKALFEGRRELFEGLYIYNKMDWEEQYPVIHLDMSGLDTRSIERFEGSLGLRLRLLAESEGIALTATSSGDCLFELIDKLYFKHYKRVVVLVDEYDKPVQDTLHKPELAAEIREALRNFYTVIKTKYLQLHFVFLTGVSKIAHVSIFSGLNNLDDISMEPQYAGICGYTQGELEAYFEEYIDQLAAHESVDRETMLAKIKGWYDGYSWDGETFVYNPFSTLLLFKKREFDPHWFRTGTPSFLLELMKKRRDFSPVMEESIRVDRTFSDSQTLERMDSVPLFFQTGYLTIKKRVREQFLLEMPNKEVRFALSNFLLSRLADKAEYEVKKLVEGFQKGLEQENPGAAIEFLRLLFAHVTYDTHLPYEAHYHALLQLTFLLMGIPGRAEVHTDKGRADLVVRLKDVAYIVELKYAASPEGLEAALEEGMEQIKRRRYYETEIGKGRKVWLLALAVTQGQMSYRAVVL